ncbi:MAG: class I SAM-dependent methyltransferase, partial [Eubacteriales bacterium]|nr:class I SAM-dependent methyltransferase [Eubacteriales bacterium]
MENIYNNSAWLYDLDNRDHLSADIPFYLEYAKKQNGEILELGCGTGRVALALAAGGLHVTGLDLSQPMLDIFRDKLSARPEYADKINLVYGNMRNFRLDKKFAMIIAPFRAFQAVTDDVDIFNTLLCVRGHLVNDGIFIVNVFNPRPVMDESWCYDETVQWERLDEHTGNYVVKKHRGDKIDTEKQIIYPRYIFEVTYPGGRTQRITEDLKLKYYYRE